MSAIGPVATVAAPRSVRSTAGSGWTFERVPGAYWVALFLLVAMPVFSSDFVLVQILGWSLILGIGLIAVGWASGGGAWQVLFTLFSELVFQRGATGLGQLWATAGVGLLIGGFVGNRIGKRIAFENYKKTVFFCYLLHGAAYIIFSQMRGWGWALFFMGLSRASVAVSSVLNWSNLLKHVDDRYRGRVFSTIETMSWSTMMISMLAAGVASQHFSVRMIGAASGALSSSTAIFWGWANWNGKLPEPAVTSSDDQLVEIHGDAVG